MPTMHITNPTTYTITDDQGNTTTHHTLREAEDHLDWLENQPKPANSKPDQKPQ